MFKGELSTNRFLFRIIMRHLILLPIITGCATSQPEVFRLSTGELVTCQRYAQRDCGMAIMHCGEEHAAQFDCLSDVHYVGKVGTVAKKPEPKVPADYAPEID